MNTGYTQLDEEILDSKNDAFAIDSLYSPSVARKKGGAEVKTQVERTKRNLNKFIRELVEKKSNEPLLTSEKEANADASATVEFLKNGITNYIADIKQGILSKEISIGSGFIELSCARFSPDGNYIATTSKDIRGLRVYDTHVYDLRWTSEVFREAVNCLQYYAEGRCIIAASSDKTIRTFDSLSGLEIKCVEFNFKEIYTVAINKPGNMAAIGCSDNSVSLINWPSGTVKKTFTNHKGPVKEVIFNSSGNILASCGEDLRIMLFNVQNDSVIKELKEHHSNPIYSLAFSYDDKYLASGGDDGRIRVFNMNTWEMTNFDKENAHLSGIRDLKFGLNGDRLISCSLDNTIKLWDFLAAEEIGVIENQFEDGLRSVDLNIDEKKIIACSSQSLKLFDFDTKAVLNDFNYGHQSLIKKALFDMESSKVISFSEDETIRIFDVNTGEETQKIEIVEDRQTIMVRDLAVSPNSDHFVVSCSDSTIRCFENRKPLYKVQTEHMILDINYNQAGNLLAGGCENSTIFILSSDNGEVIVKLSNLPLTSIFDVVFMENDSIILFAGSDKTIYHQQWSENKANQKKPEKFLASHTTNVKQLALSFDEHYVASLDESGELIISDVAAKRQIHSFGAEAGINSIGFTYDGKRIISGGLKLNVYDLETKIKLMTIEYREKLNYVQFSRDGKRLLTCGQINLIEVFKTDAGKDDYRFFGQPGYTVEKIMYNIKEDRYFLINNIKEFMVFESQSNKIIHKQSLSKSVYDMVLDREEKALALVGEMVYLMNPSDYSELSKLEITPDNAVIRSVIFSKDQKQILIGSYDGNLRYLDRKNLKTIKQTLPAEKHKDWIRAIANHPTLNQIASGGDDYTIKFWDAYNLKLLQVINPGHTNFINTICFDKTGSLIFSSGYDNNLIVSRTNKTDPSNILAHKIENGKFHNNVVLFLALSNSGEELVSCCSDGSIKVWETRNFQLLTEFKSFPGPAARSKLNNSNNKILTATRNDIKLFDIRTNYVEFKHYGNPQSTIFSLMFTPDNSKIICVEESIISLLDSKDCSIIGKIEATSGFCTNVAFVNSSIGDKVGVGFANGEIKIYDLYTFQELRKDNVIKISLNIEEDQEENIDFNPNEGLKTIYFHKKSDHEILLLNSSVRIYNTNEKRFKILWKGLPDTFISASNLSKGGDKLVFEYDSTLRVFDLYESKEILCTKKRQVGFAAVQFSPNADRIYCLLFDSGNKNEVLILDATSGYTIKSHFIPNGGHSFLGFFSPNCKSLAIWNIYSHIKLLETDCFIESQASNQPLEDVRSVAFSHDSQRIITASSFNLISFFEDDAPSSMNDFYIINKKFENHEKNNDNVDINEVLNRKVDLFSLLGHTCPFNIFHFLCLFNYEKGLKKFLKNIEDNKMNLLYSLLNHKDFLDNTPFELCIKSGFVNILETLIKLQAKIKPEIKFLSDRPFTTDTLGKILNYYPSYLPQIFNNQLASWNMRKFLKLSIDVKEALFLPYFNSKFSAIETIEKECLSYQSGSSQKKTDFIVQVLMIDDILMPQNQFMNEISGKLLEDNEIFESDAFSALLEYKWRNFGRKKFLLNMYKYVGYFLLVVTGSLIIFPIRKSGAPIATVSATGIQKPPEKGTIEYLSVGVNITTLLYLYILIGSYEAKQIYIKRVKYFTESIWNCIDAFLILLGTVVISIDLLEIFGSFGEDSKTQLQVLKILLFFNLLATWLRMGDFWRGFRPTAALVRLLARVFSDMRAFFLVLFYMLVGFALSAYLLQDNYLEHGRWNFVKTYYKTLLGEDEDYEKVTSTTAIFEEFYFFIYFIVTIFFIIVMLNLLIAIISDSYSKVNSVEKKAFQFERLNLLIEYEEIMGKKEKSEMEEKLKGCFLYSVKAYNEVGEEEDDISKDYKQAKKEQFNKIYYEVGNNKDILKILQEDQRSLGENINKQSLENKLNHDSLIKGLQSKYDDLNKRVDDLSIELSRISSFGPKLEEFMQELKSSYMQKKK